MASTTAPGRVSAETFDTGVRALILAVATAVVLAGCGERRASAPTAAVRDSAGIRIVESAAPRWVAGEEWMVEGEPAAAFGDDDALYRIRGTYRLPDGRVVVADGTSLEILVYSGDGVLLQRHGGAGAGPGEYRELSRIFRGAADSLVVYDYPNYRMSVLAPDGRFVRSYAPPPLADGAPGLVEGGFGDGALLVTPIGGPPAGQGLVRRTRELYRLTDGEPPVPLAEFPEQEQFFFRTMPRPIAWRQPFFGQTAYYTTGGSRLYWGVTDTFGVKVVDSAGRITAVYRRAAPERTWSTREKAPLIENSVREYPRPEAQPLLRAVLEEMPSSGRVPEWGWPDWAPRYGPALQLDDDGNVWVAEYDMPGAERNARSVFDTDGVWLGTVLLPPRFAPYHIGADFMLGVQRDELDVEHVRLYRLIRP